VEGGLK
jgi:hypothetical protein